MICTRCKIEKEEAAFPKAINRKSGLSAWCRACHKSYRKENREAIRAKQIDYRAKNPEYIASLNSDWMKRNAEHQKKMKRKYRSEKPHVQASLNAKYRASLKRATPSWADPKAIERLYEQAACLTRETGIVHHVDHIYPLQSKIMCGLHVETNLRVIPAEINQAKGNRLIFIPPESINLSSVMIT